MTKYGYSFGFQTQTENIPTVLATIQLLNQTLFHQALEFNQDNAIPKKEELKEALYKAYPQLATMLPNGLNCVLIKNHKSNTLVKSYVEVAPFNHSSAVFLFLAIEEEQNICDVLSDVLKGVLDELDIKLIREKIYNYTDLQSA